MLELFILHMQQLRKEQHFSQAGVARQIGVSYPAYRRYEQGERDMPLSVAVRLADLYGVTLDYLVGRSEAR